VRFEYSDEQREIRDTARAFLRATFPPARVRELLRLRQQDESAWRKIIELGWLHAGLDEEAEEGFGLVELAAIQEELGYHLAPVPFLSGIGAAMVIARAGSEEQRARWLPPILSGELRASFAAAGSDGVPYAFDAAAADVVVILNGKRAELLGPESFSVERVSLLDISREYFRICAHAGASQMPGEAKEVRARLRVALAAESVGVAQRALDLAVDHAKRRVQFGRPIGSFQAVSHRCARMLRQIEMARATTLYAAYIGDHEPDALPMASSVAKASASDAGWQVPSAAIQVHGGMGFTWEHDCHLLLRRGRTNAEFLGSSREQLERIADLLASPSAESTRRSTGARYYDNGAPSGLGLSKRAAGKLASSG
jgi:alkylation response protein AidB-like acyl-CoA dehydrogenase